MARVKWNWPRISLHVLFWLVYLPVNATLACLIQGIELYENLGQAIIAEAVLLPLKIALVCFIFYFVIPMYLRRERWYKLVLYILLGFTLAVIAYRLTDTYIYLPIFAPDVNVPTFSATNMLLALFDIFITTSAATTIKMIRVQYNSLEYEQELIREKLQSELEFLRAQTNPHFLFNTLNNLYGLARKKSDKAPEGIMMLSKIMRFMLYDCRAHHIPLASEAKVIQDYIELEKLRYNDRLTVDYHLDLDNPSAVIAPLLLLPFVENSFKHGAHSSTDEARIQIRLQLKNNQLEFDVHNTYDPNSTNADPRDERYSGIGIRNERRQLDLLYPQRHSLDITESNGWYRANLRINLSEN